MKSPRNVSGVKQLRAIRLFVCSEIRTFNCQVVRRVCNFRAIIYFRDGFYVIVIGVEHRRAEFEHWVDAVRTRINVPWAKLIQISESIVIAQIKLFLFDVKEHTGDNAIGQADVAFSKRLSRILVFKVFKFEFAIDWTHLTRNVHQNSILGSSLPGDNGFFLDLNVRAHIFKRTGQPRISNCQPLLFNRAIKLIDGFLSSLDQLVRSLLNQKRRLRRS
mmetsp:Transcript_1321/g.3929  ORF Transcript_1321/g.3929 Transcript_1321/m.3929 type:complete len:218 (-) Transcript_1321:2837-3490(-)